MRRQMAMMVLSAAMLLPRGVAARDVNALDKGVFEALNAKAKETVNVTLDGQLLKMAGGFLSSDGDEDSASLKKMVSSLKSITVRSFQFDKEGSYSDSDLKTIRSEMNVAQWSRIVDVHEREARTSTEIFLMQGHEHPEGLLIISAEPKELTVVQIIGNVDLNHLEAFKNFGVHESDVTAARKAHK